MSAVNNQGLVWLAGEASGDFIASLIMPEVQKTYPGEKMQGIGGPKMAACGFDDWYPSSRLSVRGYIEVLGKIPELIALRANMLSRTMKASPRAFIGVDAPDFNLGLEIKLRNKGLRTVHLVCPAFWAWRPGRIETIKKAVDHMLCLFPFEKGMLDKFGVDSTYIGHPLASIIPMFPNKARARYEMGIETDGPVFCVMPGSRAAEIKYCAPVFFEACKKILSYDARSNFYIPASDPVRKLQIENLLRDDDILSRRVTLVDGQSHRLLEACDAVLAASGTATLEAALFKRPMVVGYKMPALTGMLMQKKGTTHFVSLPNILTEERLVPELLQYYCTADAIAGQLWLAYERRDDEELMRKYIAIHRSLLRNTPELAAKAIEGVCQ